MTTIIQIQNNKLFTGEIMKNIFSSLYVVGFFLIIAGLLTPVYSQWSTNPNINNALCTATRDQYSPKITSDGAGGAIVTWEDFRSGYYDIYAQRINAAGTSVWSADGVALCLATGDQNFPAITSDGTGGAIVTWRDIRSGVDQDVYAQRINAAGTILWATNGVAVCTAIGEQFTPTITSDGTGGAIVTWNDNRSGNFDIYAQRINASGLVVWTTDGVALCTASMDQNYPQITSDVAGGAIVTWLDYRNGTNYDIYTQRVNASGSMVWSSNGEALCTATGNQDTPSIISDEVGGAIIAWQDFRSGTSYDIYSQRISPVGGFHWIANGIALCTATGNQYSPLIIGDGSEGAIVTWYDLRNGSNSDIYVQRIGATGGILWNTDGVALCVSTGNQYSPTIANDGAGGAFVTWYDSRSVNYDIYAQRINGLGIVQWTINGVTISTATWDQRYPTLVLDGAGGAIVTWRDSRNNGLYDIYVQNIDRNGYLGDARPTIIQVNDIVNDQGKKVTVKWTHSYVDEYPTQTISWYDIWRGVKRTEMPPQMEVLTMDEYASRLESETVPQRFYVKQPLYSSSADTIYWNLVGSVNANWQTGYSYDVSTPSDSGLQGIPWSYFKTTARTTNPLVFWDSNTDSGYSVDNLPPTGIMLLSASRLNNSSVELAWNGNHTDADLEHYAVYRSTRSDFPINEETRISTTNDTLFVDEQATSTATMYYKVTAVDKNGNEGEASPEVIVTGVTDVAEENTSPKEFLLSQNYPNPFNPLTVISYQLPISGYVTLKLYNVLGEEVATRVDEFQEAGYKSVRWEASELPDGIYLCRLTAGSYSAAIKLVYMK